MSTLYDRGILYGTLAQRRPSALLTQIASKQPLNGALSSLADLNGAPDTFPYFTDLDALALTALSPFARGLLADASAIISRATLGNAYQELGNVVTDYGADPTGLMGSATQLAAAIAGIGTGGQRGVFFPAGNFFTSPLVLPNKTGFRILGSGSPNDTNLGASIGSYITSYAGYSGSAVLTFTGAGIDIEGLTILGSSTAVSGIGAPASSSNGIAWGHKSTGSIGSGNSLLTHVTFIACAVGVDIGITGTGLDTANCDTYTFLHCSWANCDTCVRLNQDQNILHTFITPTFGNSTLGIDAAHGGNIVLLNVSTYNLGTLIKVTTGGQSATIRVVGGHIDSDSATVRTVLYEAAGSSNPCLVEFDSISVNPNQLTVAGNPRVTVQTGHTVILRNMSNLGSSDGAIAKLDGGGTVIIDSCRIPSNPAYVIDPASSGGKYRVVNCIDESTGDFIPAYGDIDPSGDALTTDPLSQFAATTSAQLAGVISDETGSGALVFANSPTLVTPTLGAASVTTINGVTITGSGTLATGTFTLTVSGTASVSGTNTGDQTSVSGNAGTATALQTARTLNGASFDGTANITVPSPDGYTTIVASADQDTTATQTIHSEFQFAVTAGKVYQIEMEFTISGASATNDFAFSFVLDDGIGLAGMAGYGNYQCPSTSLAITNVLITVSGNTTANLAVGTPANINTPVAVKMILSITVDTTTTCKFRFGPNSGSTNVRVWGGSIMRWKELN